MSATPIPLDAAWLNDAVEGALALLNNAVTEPGHTWYATPVNAVGPTIELRFQLLDDATARATGLLD